MQTTLVTINGFFGNVEQVELKLDGEITQDVVEVFTCGQCHSFAAALHRYLPESEIVGVLWEPLDDEDVYVPNHVAVRDRFGRVWDVRGRVPKPVAFDAEPLDREYVLAALDGQYHPPRVELAEVFIPAWLDKHPEALREVR